MRVCVRAGERAKERERERENHEEERERGRERTDTAQDGEPGVETEPQERRCLLLRFLISLLPLSLPLPISHSPHFSLVPMQPQTAARQALITLTLSLSFLLREQALVSCPFVGGGGSTGSEESEERAISCVTILDLCSYELCARGLR